MNWDELLIEACTETDGKVHPQADHVLTGAKWQRDQLRTDEAIERVAAALFGEETELDWEYAAQWVRDDYGLFARRAITALLGDT